MPILAWPPHGAVHGAGVPVEVGVQRLEVMLRNVCPDELPIARPDKAIVLAGLVIQTMIIDGVVIAVQQVAPTV